ncbi:MAG: hypothetical protein ACOYJE_00960 [Bacteroidaceae bacterium]|jgi:hypothetical protein
MKARRHKENAGVRTLSLPMKYSPELLAKDKTSDARVYTQML